jgi:N-acetylglucosaminyldiphosphoundecaprenol N-acetyl-beta-D-mannosaminyltransferase
MKKCTSFPNANVLGISIEAITMEGALDRISRQLESRRKGYICMAGVHGIVEAHRNLDLAVIYAASTMTLPDGAPTAWVGRSQGKKEMRRVAGPELMLEIFRRKEFANYSHFLYGGEEGVAQQLQQRLTAQFPWARIVAAETPPFRPLTPLEEESLAARVQTLRPDIFWVGISTPKQEYFMSQNLNRLDTRLMLGVGAAFDYHTGRIKDSPRWVKQIGMQWFHRLLQDPRRLWKRYLSCNSTFLWNIGLQLTGLKNFEPAQSVAITTQYCDTLLSSSVGEHPTSIVSQ